MYGKCFVKEVLLTLTLVALCQTNASADPTPKNTQAVNPEDILAIYSGKSWRWNDVGGGAFHAVNGKLVAVLENDGIIGIGRWSVDRRGTLCHKATWYWRSEKPKQRKVKDCWEHVVDQDGALWQHDRRHGWYKFRKQQLSNGDKYGRRVNRVKKKLGL